ncbi:MAG: TonB-dependent receptor [Bacteroidaceae bacterium]|nr:TonB-dependent receptor [Bacteroidaceae bacterium]
MTFIAAFISLFITTFAETADTIMLAGIDVVSSVKLSDDADKQPYSVTTIGRADIENRHINSIKELTAIAPNFYQPDYGSRMTSSIYVRGFGSRIDQPVVGMNIDQQPVMNKNNYDFELFDIDKVQIIRGAQSTLFGRNTSGGTINITTLSPLNFQGKRLSVEYGNENNIRIKAAHYEAASKRFGWSVGTYYNHSDGFFTNNYTGDNCDGGDNAAVRARFQWLPADRWSIDNTFTVGYTDEGGWGYRLYDGASGTLAPIAYNEECYYRRFNLSDGLVVKRFFDNFTISSATGYQYTDDKMHLDNDFLASDYFTMEQAQREHSITQEFVIKSRDDKALRWTGGLFAFYKYLQMEAPVHFREVGIRELIAKRLPSWFTIDESAFDITDDFTIPTYGVAAYLQGGYTVGAFDIEVGLRVDYENSSMDYYSHSLIHYNVPGKAHEPLPTTFKGTEKVDALELLPGFSITYRHRLGNIYASVRKGFKAGGFNTQIFSDILQNKMIRNMQGIGDDTDASATKYKPEESLNYEIGGNLSLLDDRLNLAASLFYIDCTNQQLTIHPTTGTGRIMSNAGESRSYGCEVAARYDIGHFTINAAYGYTNAKFEKFTNEGISYKGKQLPYAPRETASLNVAYKIPVARTIANHLILNIGWNGIGRIYWNEANTLSQSFYGLWQASLSWEKGHFGASLWGKNLLDEKYHTFYFRSISNDFFAEGKPLQAGVSFHINL